MNTPQQIRKAIRITAGFNPRNTRPIEIVGGTSPPKKEGECWHYITRGGTYIRYPSAYSRAGCSNMIYIHSTRRVVVGRDWLRRNNICPAAVNL